MVFKQQADQHFKICGDAVIGTVRAGILVAGFFAVKRRMRRHYAYPQHEWAVAFYPISAQNPMLVVRIDDIQTRKDRI